MRRGAIISAALHLAVIVVLIIGLPHFMRSLPEDTQPVPIEVVTIADKTAVKPQDRPPEPPQPPKPKVRPAPPQPQQQVAVPKPQPTPPPPAPKEKAEVKPPPAPEKAPEPKPEPVPEKTAKKEPPPKAPEKAAPKERFADAKPQKKPLPPQPSRDDFVANLLKNVAPQKVASDQPAPKPEKNPTPPKPVPKVSSVSDQMTISEIDAIRRQFSQCWNYMAAGGKDSRNLVVSIHIELDPSGRVLRANIVDTSRMSDPVYRTAAESALRAVLNPLCNPLKNLPAKKYDTWKSMTLDFNPSDMLG
jgi:hypothetical protein